MKVLKLVVYLEPGMSIAELANVFGDYTILGQNHRWMSFTFASVNMLSAKHLKPIHDLIKTYEIKKPLTFKMFYLHDSTNDTYSPVAIHCDEGKWYTVTQSTGAESSTTDNLFSLF